MTDSSSEDEELLLALKESEANFASNLYSTKTTEECDSSKTKFSLPESLRSMDDQADPDNTNALFTPGVQKYIAKHLSCILDRQLKEVQFSKPEIKKNKHKSNNGINLLNESQAFLSWEDVDDISVIHNMKMKRLKTDTHSDEDMTKVKESAVSADWILSGEAVRGWEKNTKGEVFPGVFKDSVPVKKKKRKKKKKSEISETVK